VYGIVQVRTAYLRQRQRELEEKVRERTARLEEASRALEEASLTDPLTGLRNRRFLAQNIESETALALRRYGAGAAAPLPGADLVFALVDLDHFKQVNDVHGHDAGDAVLVQMRDRLRQVVRDSDYLVRWGGEEFLVVARASARGDAEDLASRLRAAVADTPFALPDATALPRTCSVGFACFPFLVGQPGAVSWQEVVNLADLALYGAKRAGRNGWVGLAAGAGARPEGLGRRIKERPREAIENDEARLRSDLPLEAVAQALGRA